MFYNFIHNYRNSLNKQGLVVHFLKKYPQITANKLTQDTSYIVTFGFHKQKRYLIIIETLTLRII